LKRSNGADRRNSWHFLRGGLFRWERNYRKDDYRRKDCVTRQKEYKRILQKGSLQDTIFGLNGYSETRRRGEERINEKGSIRRESLKLVCVRGG